MMRKLFFASVFAMSVMLLFFVIAEAVNNHYEENFTSRQYCDTLNTKALWDTISGELKLPPFELILAGSYDTPGGSADLALAGDMAFVADAAAGLVIVDISNPASPSLLGSYDTPGSAQGLWIDGDWAYVCDDGPGLLIIDISNGAAPSLVGSYNTGGRAFGVEVAGGYAYVADGAEGLKVVDVSNPASPSLAGSCDTPGFARTIDVEGNYAYIADRAGGGLQIIDISDPTLPTPAGSYSTGGDTWGVEVSGNVAFVGAASAGLLAVDVTDPSNPALLSSIATGSARQLHVEGDYVYVAGYGALYVIDVRDPSNPLSAGSYTTPGIASDVTVAGQHAYVADGADGGLQVIDICEYRSPSGVGSSGFVGTVADIAVTGDYVYIAGGYYGFYVSDISDPTCPSTVGSYNPPGIGYALDVDIAGDHAYIANGEDGFYVIDISDPTNPSPIANYDTLDYLASGVAISGDYAYVAYQDIGLLVFNIADPATPSLEGNCDTPDLAYDVTLSGQYAYVADDESGLQVIDISDPTNPSLAGSYDTPGQARNITIAGDYAYVADYFSGLQVIDISDPTSPSLAGSYVTLDPVVRGVAISGDYACVADYDNGLHVIDISDPTNPTMVEQGNVVCSASCAKIAGDYAFLGCSSSDFKVVWIFQRFLDEAGNRGQSVRLNSSNYDIGFVKLSSTQNDSVQWQVSTDGGAIWQDVLPNQPWYSVNWGNDLRWRSMHLYTHPFANPTCSNLSIEWFIILPMIDTITDIPNDQGRQVSISWTRSGYDFLGSPTPVTEYAIYRKIDNTLSLSLPSEGSAPPGNEMPVKGGEPSPRLSYPPGNWHYLMTVPADCEETYSAVVPTLADSTISGGMYYTTFFVSAFTGSPGEYFDSPPDSGYSVDNLAPSVPEGFEVAYNQGSGNQLSWEECPDEDFQCFRIYRSEREDFEPAPGNLVHTTSGIDWLDTVEEGWKYYYRIASVDGAGNQSEPAAPGETTGTDVPEAPGAFALYQNAPNPFNPVTTIRFDLPFRSRVKLAVYNVRGQLVRVILDGDVAAGWKEVVWDGRDYLGRPVAAGIYFYRFDSKAFRESRKMILIR
jgi:hypothetical protein